jgi:hypothetical protein
MPTFDLGQSNANQHFPARDIGIVIGENTQLT